MTRLTLVVASLVVSLTAPAAMADDQEPGKDGRSVWMKQKLDRSKDILEGLSQADFDKVAKAAQAMRLLTRVEAFARGGTPGYRKHLESFEDAADEIFAQANDDNLEGVALAFHQLTNSCVTCHKQLRKSKSK
jgi:cytochrome c556